jgi:hypothetical protein
MKKIFTSIALASLFLPAVMSAQTAPTPELLYYKFDGTGTSVPNLAISPPPGTTTATIVGGQTQGSSGQCGGALIGTGQSSNNDYVNTGWSANLSGTSWTISFWTSNVPSTTTTYYILGDVNAGGLRVFTGGIAGAGNWILRGGLNDVLANGGASTGPSLTTFVYDMPNNEIRSYVNGVLNQTVAQSFVSISGSGLFKVGGYSTSSSLPNNSLMDEFRLYDRALSVAEIQSLMVVNTTSSFNITVCDSYTAPSGAVHTTSGTYMDTIPNANGCDSVMTISVTVNSRSTAIVTTTVCNAYYAPSGNLYTASGNYMDTIPNAIGCDSVITINLTVNHASGNTVNATTCSTYTGPSGAIYSATGTYLDTIPNVAGCDSVTTINLVVNTPTSATINPVVCASYTAPSGAVYTTSGMYMDIIPNMAGCDSVITINLTVNQSYSTFSMMSCDSVQLPGGSMIYSSGTYMDTIPNMLSCDSVMTINVTINSSTSSSMNAAACDMYTAPSGAVLTASGTYTDIIPNAMGCDSVITISLTINTVNANATVAGAVLTATASGATYQWMSCNPFAIIANATSQSYTATANGDYAVIVTQNSCTDTSACMSVTGIGMAENVFGGKLNIYPNPSNGEFFVDLGAVYTNVTIVVTDVTGRVMYTQSVNDGNVIPVALDASSGIYMVTVTAENNKAMIRLIKE